jgi:hypothetical protein
MDTHVLAGVLIAVVIVATFAMIYESDIRARVEKAGQRKRMRERAKLREREEK